jgi:hypothetical protein
MGWPGNRCPGWVDGRNQGAMIKLYATDINRYIKLYETQRKCFEELWHRRLE